MLSRDLTAFVDPIISVCEKQFPLKCGNCGKHYASFQEFVDNTTPVGAPAAFDGESDPIGILSYVNCSCHSTLTLCCEDMTGEQHKAFFTAIERETTLSKKSSNEILAELRSVIRGRVSVQTK